MLKILFISFQLFECHQRGNVTLLNKATTKMLSLFNLTSTYVV